jgi:hypothetical protein
LGDAWSPDEYDNGLTPMSIDEIKSIESEKSFILDYPDQEVRKTMSWLVTRTILGGEAEVKNACTRVAKAFDQGNVDGLVEEFNAMLARADYKDYLKALDPADLDGAEKPLGEGQYRSLLYALIWGSGLGPIPELHGGHGRAVPAILGGGRPWVTELKLSDRVASDTSKAKAGLARILDTGYADGFGRPGPCVHGREQGPQAGQQPGVPIRLGRRRRLEKSAFTKTAEIARTD